VAELKEVLSEIAIEASAAAGDPDRLADLQVSKWRAIHKHIHRNPFHVPESLARSDQWRKVLDHLKRTVGEAELTDWLIVQVDVAANLEAGIRDLRPRKSDPCYDIVMEYVNNQKRKAVAVLRWARGKGGPDFPSFSASRLPFSNKNTSRKG